MHGWLFKDINYVANDALKFNNAINICLINLNVILNSFLSNKLYLLFRLHYGQLKNYKQYKLMKFHLLCPLYDLLIGFLNNTC